MFLSAKNSPCGSHPDGLTRIIESMKHSKHTGGRPPLGKARKQEYRITLRLNTEHKLRLQALARAAGRPRTEVLRQLIAAGRVRERLRREHLDIMSQFKGLARNLNQLTHLAHAKGFTGIVSRQAAIVVDIEALLKNLRDDLTDHRRVIICRNGRICNKGTIANIGSRGSNPAECSGYGARLQRPNIAESAYQECRRAYIPFVFSERRIAHD